ncbi:protein of unknown function [Nitrospira japonica]|uniref:Uncharacterized protein n=1 Tax=Nitrospira japonica TaxID=1325564 RepID=A0A1W1I0N8_9BACT|nr:protein of unknown function [Nitrospira japonica]
MQRLSIQLPAPLKAKLDAEKKRDTSGAELIRHVRTTTAEWSRSTAAWSVGEPSGCNRREEGEPSS